MLVLSRFLESSLLGCLITNSYWLLDVHSAKYGNVKNVILHSQPTSSCVIKSKAGKIERWTYTGCLQMNGAVSKVNKKFISHLTRAKRTPLAAATVQVSHALPAVSFSCLLRAEGWVSKMAPQQEKSFCVLRFEVSISVITVQREFRACFRKGAPCMVKYLLNICSIKLYYNCFNMFRCLYTIFRELICCIS